VRLARLAGHAGRVRHLSYLAMLLACLAATLPLERLLGTRVLARPRRLAGTLALAAAPFLAWDLYAVSRAQWSFDDAQILGPRVPGGLPLEEVAFFVVVPLAVVFTLEAVRAALGRRRGDRA
jgi:lycopene cyclase domain-containing protein